MRLNQFEVLDYLQPGISIFLCRRCHMETRKHVFGKLSLCQTTCQETHISPFRCRPTFCFQSKHGHDSPRPVSWVCEMVSAPKMTFGCFCFADWNIACEHSKLWKPVQGYYESLQDSTQTHPEGDCMIYQLHMKGENLDHSQQYTNVCEHQNKYALDLLSYREKSKYWQVALNQVDRQHTQCLICPF